MGINDGRSGTGYMRPVVKFTKNIKSKLPQYVASTSDGRVAGTYTQLVRAFEVQFDGDETSEAIMVAHEFQARDLLDKRARGLMR